VTVRGSIYATNGNFSFNGSGNTTVINGNGVTINIPVVVASYLGHGHNMPTGLLIELNDGGKRWR
jgi:hypothetical protein